ncbi:3-isopropylmalate dehydratase [Aquibium sp. A9E412]|uniref:LeuD/DmdB family oxidoreductase small subunit n=1 Tax=Aquibium sp. A9E412 TaxID=2976767 RepID=UPI0025B17D3C|nr:3-isopropylmalate dehydratase [Aquibium sp. A9E412]MDN2567192.1 3-isopropylmalate dehydratase [Aquibium sp. A9E412]
MAGRVFLVGDDIDTDQLAPGRYMAGGVEALAQHCLEGVRPDFARTVRPGDILVAGRNFGAGSSREQAVEALRHLGVAGIVAHSFAGIFFRNAINLGLPVMTAADLGAVADGDRAELDVAAAALRLPDRGETVALAPLADNLRALLADGGLVPHLKKRFAAREAQR